MTVSTEAAQVCLDKALGLVDEALVAAETGAWERVSDLDARCRDASTSMAEELRGYDPMPLLRGLTRLRDRHHRLLELAERRRDQLAQASRDSRRGRQGARAYEDNT
jgi:hypothetical protein